MQPVSIKNRCCWLHLPSCSLVPFQAESIKNKKNISAVTQAFILQPHSHTLINSILIFSNRYFHLRGFFLACSHLVPPQLGAFGIPVLIHFACLPRNLASQALASGLIVPCKNSIPSRVSPVSGEHIMNSNHIPKHPQGYTDTLSFQHSKKCHYII